MEGLRLLQDEEKPKRKLNPTSEFIFCAFVPVWNERYPNQKYFLSGMDAKFVKEFLKDNPDIEVNEIQSRAVLYIKDDWWSEQKHPAWGLVRHFNKYIPELKKEAKRKPIMIHCEYCHKLRQPFGCCEHCGK